MQNNPRLSRCIDITVAAPNNSATHQLTTADARTEKTKDPPINRRVLRSQEGSAPRYFDDATRT